jgi:hypothetical protein
MMHGGGFFGGSFGGGFGISGRRFEEQYHCYSVAYADKSQLEVSETTQKRRQVPIEDHLISYPHISERRQNSASSVCV